MKRLIFLMYLVTISVTALAGKKNEPKNPIIGTWKFSRQSINNDFQKKFDGMRSYPIEYLTFYEDHTFKHEFLDTKNNTGKTLIGKWKNNESAITINYSDIEFAVNSKYFFLDNDLVIGQNFNHVIFTKSITDFPIVMK